MNRLFLIPVFFLVLITSCKQEKLTLAQLEKADWDSLAPGIDYISKEKKEGNSKNDSIYLTLKGVSGRELPLTELSFDTVSGYSTALLLPILKTFLLKSKRGYLRVNFIAMLRPEYIEGTIYLRGDYGPPFSFSSDSTTLKNMGGIKTIRYISKEEGKKKFMDQDNDDWNKALDTNPLPNAISIMLEKGDWTEESLNKLKDKILGELEVTVSDIKFPMSLVKKSYTNFFFEYERK